MYAMDAARLPNLRKSDMTAKRIVFVLSFLLAYTCVAVAQTDTGTPSYEPTMQVNPYESVNLATLSILLQAPVRSKGGPIPLNFILSNNVQLYVSSGSYATAASQTLLTRGYWAGQI